MLAFGDPVQLFDLAVPPKEVLIEHRLSNDILDGHNNFVLHQICRKTILLYNI